MNSAVPSFDELRGACLNCRECGLSERRTNVVFGEGDWHSPLMLVGEGPGDTEDKTGRPFVGKAGQLLDKGLRDAGISREQVYITNTVKCRAADWSSGRPMNRPPTDEEAAACRHWLFSQIGLIRPKVILCVGAPSARNLIKKNFKITQERGLYFQSEHAKTILATLHPSYILRNMSASGDDGGYSLLVQDIRKAWDAAQRLAAKGEEKPEPAEDRQGSLF
ncbi:MAG TPA: uracil-DNA glycosylase [Fimbriimonadaceae bacterium]|nr:uracil-DNA glycosylase [Fimbriimonadaceae bacterium]